MGVYNFVISQSSLIAKFERIEFRGCLLEVDVPCPSATHIVRIVELAAIVVFSCSHPATMDN